MKRKKKSTELRITELLMDKMCFKPSNLDLMVLNNANMKNVKFFASLKKGLQKFTSTSYTLSKKTADFFVRFSDDQYGKIKFYFKHENENYALFEKYIVDSQVDHILIVKPNGQLVFKSIHTIESKFIYMKIQNKEFICCRPNRFEVN